MTAIEPPSHQPDTQASAAADIFYSKAIDRIRQSIIILGGIIFPLIWLRYGVLSAGGFLLGVLISYMNFHWLTRAVNALADRIAADSSSNESGSGIVFRFLVRYLLIGLAAYVTFVSWPQAFRGLLIGLCLPVAGMMGEAAFETYVALRRGL
jgi:fatty-acid desaturase